MVSLDKGDTSFRSIRTVVKGPIDHPENRDLHVHCHTAQREAIRSHHDKTKLLLLTGVSGSGKTRLLQDTLPNCYTGKFDALRRPEPYRPFADALTEWARDHHDQQLDGLEEDERRVLEIVIPALNNCWGDNKSNEKLPQDETLRDRISTTQRFGSVFRKLIGSLTAKGDDPVVFLFDDLQYAGHCAMDLLRNLMADLQDSGKSSNVLIAATCSCSPPEPVVRFLEELTSMDRIKEVRCTHLETIEITKFLSGVVEESAPEKLELLAELVQAQTDGILFRVVEFVRWLLATGLISQGNRQQWSVEQIQTELHVTSQKSLLQQKLSQLSPDALNILRISACLGSQVDERLIGYVVKGAVLSQPVHAIVEEAHAKGIFVRKRGFYEFSHDGMLNAAYESIPTDEREILHVTIGRRLWQSLSPTESNPDVFVLLSQMNLGKVAVKNKNERHGLADLCLFAGRKAAKLSAFRVASIYMNLGIEFMGQEGWQDKYEMTLALHNGAAEMSVCIGNLEQMETFVASVKGNVRTSKDFLQAETTRLYAIGMSGNPESAIDLGLDILNRLGEAVPRDGCYMQLLFEVLSVKWLLRNKTNEQLLQLPTMTDTDKLACIRTINLISLHALMFRPKLLVFLTLRFVKLTLRHGLSLMAPQAFSVFAVILSNFNDFDRAFRFGELSLQLLDGLGHDESLPRVYASYYGCVWPIRNPIKDVPDKHGHAYRVGMQTGDHEFAFLNACMRCWCAFQGGAPLPEIDSQWVSIQSEMRPRGQQTLLDMADGTQRVGQHLMGLADPSYNSIALERRKHAGPVCFCMFRDNQLLALYILNDEVGMRDIIQECLDFSGMILMRFDDVLHSWMCSLVLLGLAATKQEKRRAVRDAGKSVRKLKKLLSECPQNFLDRINLLEAEIALVQGRYLEAEIKYLQAIGLAKVNQNLFLEAKTRERIARLYYSSGKTREALRYIKSARTCYFAWGAKLKVDMLDVEIGRMEKLCVTS